MPPVIDDYRFGEITIDGETYREDVIVLPDLVVPGWWRREGHRLHLSDLERILERNPSIFILGCGAFGQLKVPTHVRDELEAIGLELHALPTREAVDLYNRTQAAKLTAGFHLTC